MPYSWVSEALDLTQMVMDIQKTTKFNLFHYTKQLFFQKHGQKVIPWDTPESMIYTWKSEALDLTQMVMDFFLPYFMNQWTKSFHLTP